MGTRYTTQAPIGYNANPPPDDGSQVAANSITWLKIKTKLSDVLNTWIANINAAILGALDVSVTTQSGSYTTVPGDHQKPIFVTGTTTISLGDATTMGAGYQVTIANVGVGVVTAALITATDTLNGVVNGTHLLAPFESVTYETSGAGYVSISAVAKSTGSFTDSRSVFLGSNVALNNVSNFFTGPTTLTIGLAGQKWLVMGVANLEDTSGGNAILEARLLEGGNVMADSSVTSSGTGLVQIVLNATVTLTNTTIFSLEARDQSTTSGLLLSTGNASTANKSTSITAIRLA